MVLRIEHHDALIFANGRFEAILVEMLVAQPIVILHLVRGGCPKWV
jgi:hypothetical protein